MILPREPITTGAIQLANLLPLGFYVSQAINFDTWRWKAPLCTSPCATYSTSADNCASCVTRYYRYDRNGGSNYNGCLLVSQLNTLQSNGRGSYVAPSTAMTGTGIACISPWKTCSGSASNCVTYLCINNQYLYDPTEGTSYTDCIMANELDVLRANGRGTYVTPGTRTDGLGIAKACHRRCVTCKDSATKCTSCPNKRPVFPIP
jgi:hypothetical protein